MFGYFNIIWKYLVDVGTILAGFGTVTAAFLAWQALSSWKAQFNHTEKFKNVIVLEKNIAVYCRHLINI